MAEESDVPVTPPKRVGRGLEGLNLDPKNMSPEVREAYDHYLLVASDESASGHELALQKAEHAVRNAIADEQARELKRMLLTGLQKPAVNGGGTGQADCSQ